MRVSFLHLDDSLILRLGSNDEGFVYSSGFSHELFGTTNGLIISRLIISLSSLRDGLPVQDVFIFTFIDKDEFSKLLDHQIPRELSLGGAHESSKCDISAEYISFVLLSKSLHDGILNGLKRSSVDLTSEVNELLRFISAALFINIVVSVKATSASQLFFKCVVEVLSLVECLVSELFNDLPLVFNFNRLLTISTLVPGYSVALFVHGVVGLLNVSLVFLVLFGNSN